MALSKMSFLIHLDLTSIAVDSFRENGRYGTNLLFLTRGERDAEGGGGGGELAWLKKDRMFRNDSPSGGQFL